MYVCHLCSLPHLLLKHIPLKRVPYLYQEFLKQNCYVKEARRNDALYIALSHFHKGNDAFLRARGKCSVYPKSDFLFLSIGLTEFRFRLRSVSQLYVC